MHAPHQLLLHFHALVYSEFSMHGVEDARWKMNKTKNDLVVKIYDFRQKTDISYFASIVCTSDGTDSHVFLATPSTSGHLHVFRGILPHHPCNTPTPSRRWPPQNAILPPHLFSLHFISRVFTVHLRRIWKWRLRIGVKWITEVLIFPSWKFRISHLVKRSVNQSLLI